MLFKQLNLQLNYLESLLNTLNDDNYCKPIKHLADATIGAHVRHILELLNCAIVGHTTGKIDYTNRIRNHSLEQDRALAISTLQTLCATFKKEDKLLVLVTESSTHQLQQQVSTTYFRELLYHEEHATHHLALIKVALIELGCEVFDASFGVAYSTLKYRKNFSKEAQAN